MTFSLHQTRSSTGNDILAIGPYDQTACDLRVIHIRGRHHDRVSRKCDWIWLGQKWIPMVSMFGGGDGDHEQIVNGAYMASYCPFICRGACIPLRVIVHFGHMPYLVLAHGCGEQSVREILVVRRGMGGI